VQKLSHLKVAYIRGLCTKITLTLVRPDILEHTEFSRAIIVLFISLTNFISCSSTMQDKKIKKIEYYNFSGKVDNSKAEEIFKTKTGLNKVEYFDTLNNLILENSFDKDMNEDNIIEIRFDKDNRVIEKLTFKNFYNQPHTKTYLSKYIYKDNLLVEILGYYGAFDTTGFFARNVVTYNQKKQKIRDEYTEYNDNAGKETRIYNWQDDYSYVEDRINKEGIIAEKHFVRLNNQGKEIEHRMNFELSSNSDTSFPIHFEYTFDQLGNELTRIKKMDGKPVENTEYEYLYENSNWYYRVFYSNKNAMWTQIRKIEYY
jgi:hypothetical protein